MKICGLVLASLVCALTGAYVLWQFHTNWGLLSGVGLELLAIAIALPTPFTAGMTTLKGGLVVIVPVILDALKGGSRRTDPKADPPKDGPP